MASLRRIARYRFEAYFFLVNTASTISACLAAIAPLLWSCLAEAGTWSDHFYQQTLTEDWSGNRDAFQIKDRVLEGVSASPVAPSPLNLVEISQDSTNCDISCWVNVVSPNTHVCTKGALILRHTGNDGYVFALHEATQTIEVYRLSTHEMLFKRDSKIELKKWYYLRAELRGATMTFFVDDQLVGSVTDTLQPSGSVGVAVQDAEAVWFDDFTITGPNVAGNSDGVSLPQVSVVQDTNGHVVIRFLATPPYDYFVQATSAPLSHDWETIGTFTAKLESFEAEISDPMTKVLRFYRVEKVHCGCR